MAEFLNMGGYGHFVWPAYIISFLVIFGLAAAIWRRGKTLKKRLAEIERQG